MAEHTNIEWCDHTFNFWIGCQEVSPACDHCYARTQNERRKWVAGWGPDGERRRTVPSTWHNLHRWNRKARERSIRAKVFCNSLSDFFDNRAASVWRREAWHYIEQCPDLDFLILTKRPQNIAKMLPDPETGVKPWGEGWPNVWLGTTAENCEELARRRGHLLYIPAAVHFLSCEPLLERIWLPAKDTYWHSLDWVICGGETGPGARMMDPAWARSLRDECSEMGIAFFLKQMTRKAPIPDDLLVREFPGARQSQEMPAGV